jgi:hypothetical protein
MKPHKLDIIPPDQVPTVQVSSFAELLKHRKLKIYELNDMLNINHRTAQRRIQEPETMTIKELVALSKGLRISEYQLLDLIRDEYQSRPSAPTDSDTPAELTD